MTQLELEPAFILHARSYRETSIIVDVFSKNKGRLSIIAKGIRSNKQKRQALMPFQPLLLGFAGRSDLSYLTHIEPEPPFWFLSGQALSCGIYLNELLCHLLPRQDPYPQLFIAYHQALRGLAQDTVMEVALRQFESQLLQALGYMPDFYRDYQGIAMEDDAYYVYEQGRGFLKQNAHDVHSYVGALLKGIAREDFNDPQILKFAKYLFREIIADVLEGKKLRSRELFV